MEFLKALKTGRTVSELMKATGLSRGGVIQALRRNTKLIKKVGTKREAERGPESTIYKLRAGVKSFAQAKRKYKARAKKLGDTTAELEKVKATLTAPVDANGTPVEEPTVPTDGGATAEAAAPDVQTAVSPEAVNEVLAANDNIEQAVQASCEAKLDAVEPA